MHYGHVWKSEMDIATKWSYNSGIVSLFKEAEIILYL